MADIVLKFLPWGITVAAIAAALFCLNLYEGERVKHAEFRAATTALAKAQEAEAENQKRRYEANLKEVSTNYESKISAIRANAVRNYGLRYATNSAGSLSGSSPGIKMDDGRSQKYMDDFVGNCGDDAAKLTAWQEWCKRNNCPVVD